MPEFIGRHRLTASGAEVHRKVKTYCYTVKNNLAWQYVKLRSPHNLVASAWFRWSWWLDSHILCGFTHPSSESRRCNRLSRDFRVWHENVMGYFVQCSSTGGSTLVTDQIQKLLSHSKNIHKYSVFIHSLLCTNSWRKKYYKPLVCEMDMSTRRTFLIICLCSLTLLVMKEQFLETSDVITKLVFFMSA